MSRTDARQLLPAPQEDLRRRVIAPMDGGMSISEAANTFAVSRQAIYNWLDRVAKGGQRVLEFRPRGRLRGTYLAAHQPATTVHMILGNCPGQLRLPLTFLTHQAVQLPPERHFSVQFSVWTAGRYPRGWILTPQKPLHRAIEHLAIRRQAKAARAEAW